MVPVSQAPRRYRIEIGAAFILYIASLFGRFYALKYVNDPALAAAITLSPILPILLMALAVYRFYRRMDEYHRMRLLKIMAIAGGATGVAAASWSFLEDVGAPVLSNFGVVFLFAGIFSLVAFLYRLEDAVSERKIGKFGRSISWAAVFAAAGAACWLAAASVFGLPWIAPLAVLVAAAAVLVFASLYIGPSAGFV